jgi:hypothetical protein
MPKKFALSKMELDEISLCPSGDNPPAKVVIAKADPSLSISKKKNPGANKPHEYVNEDEEKNGATKCDQCGMAENAPMHQAARKGGLKKAFGDWLDSISKHGGEGKSNETQVDSDTVEIDSDPDREETVPEKIKKDDLPDEVVDYIEALETEVEELQKAVDGDEPDDEDDLIEKADPEVRALIEKAQQRAEAAEAIAKAERDARIEREMLAKAQKLVHVNDNTDELAKTLKSLHEANPELAEGIEKMLTAANEQIAKSGIFSEIGLGGGDTTISKAIESRVQEIQKANPNLTREQAETQAYEENPEMYDEQVNGRA